VSVWRREHTRLNIKRGGRQVSLAFLVVRCGCRVTKGTKKCFTGLSSDRVCGSLCCSAHFFFPPFSLPLWKAFFLFLWSSCRPNTKSPHLLSTQGRLKELCRAHTLSNQKKKLSGRRKEVRGKNSRCRPTEQRYWWLKILPPPAATSKQMYIRPQTEIRGVPSPPLRTVCVFVHRKSLWGP
jgi:hypothetical protein